MRSTAPTATGSTRRAATPRPGPTTLHDALRLSPGAWGGVPVLFYGFDDFTGPELDAIRTLALIDAPVVVSLPYEDGREDVYRARAARSPSCWSSPATGTSSCRPAPRRIPRSPTWSAPC